MIKFFRKIRQRLLSENKFSKYLVYAVGEIVLVVVGILIALGINNWNLQHNQKLKTKVIFNQIVNELIIDVKNIREINAFYMYKHKLIKSYLDTDFRDEKMSSGPTFDTSQFEDLIRTYISLNIHDGGFNLLMNQTDELNIGYKEYIEELLYLYQDVSTMIEGYNGALEDMLDEHRSYNIQNHDWYSKLYYNDSLTLDTYDYYKYDPIYRNYVSYYDEMIVNIVIPSRLFSDRSIKLCKKLNKDFNLNRNIDDELSLIDPPLEIVQSIVGTYVNDKNDTLIFEEKNKRLSESTFDDYPSNYYSDYYVKIGELNYITDSVFYRNPYENIRLNPDGKISIFSIFKTNEAKKLTPVPD